MVLAFGLLMVSTAATIFALNVRNEDDASDGARRLAESAARLLVARLLKDPTLQGATCPSVTVTLESYPDGTGSAALDPATAQTIDVPLSVNNLTGTGSVPGWGETIVAPESACIVGRGSYRGRSVSVEAVLHRPRFPYVISSSVPVRAEGVHVFGVRNPSALRAGFGAVPPEEKVPGSLVTNAADKDGPALQLVGASTLIEGNAQARGTLTLSSGATVTGELRPLADVAPLPRIDIGRLDPKQRSDTSLIERSSLRDVCLSGFNRRQGNLAVTGGLNLDGGIVFVEGDVSIDGGLSGTGALIATGKVTIHGGGALSGASGTAVVAGGDLQLQGTASQRAEFRGLMYAEGGLTCEHANVAGAVVVNSSGGDRVRVESTTLVDCPALGNVSVSVTTGGTGGGATGEASFPATLHANLISAGDPYGFGVSPAIQPVRGTADSAPMLFTANMNGPKPDYSTPPPGYPVTHPPTAAEPWYEIGMPNPMPADPVSLGSIRINNPDPNAPCDSVDDNGVGWQTAYDGDYTDRESARAALIRVAEAWGSTQAGEAANRFLDDADAYMTRTLPEIIRVWNTNSRARAGSGGSTGGTSGGGTAPRVTPWKLDLNEFFNLSDRIRLLCWRVL